MSSPRLFVRHLGSVWSHPLLSRVPLSGNRLPLSPR